ncbi:putative reverse transcriptase domain-containing protein, partial [Tanacetum coccineum]
MLNFLEFSYNNSYHSSIRCAPFEALYGRKCRSPVLWAKIRESRLIGPELMQDTTDKVVFIKEKLKAARDRQKSYVDNRRRPLEFEVGDQVLVKVSPWKGVIRLGKTGKLAPRYVRPFEILERIGLVAYRLGLLEELSSVHDTFHVSNLKKCLVDANLHVPLDEIKVDKTLRFVEEPIEIMDRDVKSLKRSKIPIVKVCWNSKRGPEFTWEREDHMKANYPDCLFTVLLNLLVKFQDEISLRMGYCDNRDLSRALLLIVPAILQPNAKLKEEEEEKEESKKKRSKEASGMGSNSEPPGYAAIDNEVESDLEITAKSEPKCKEMEDTYYDGKGGAVALTRWIDKMESVIENSRYAENQKVKYVASSFINKALTWWNTQVQERGHKAAMAITWVQFKALLVEEFYPSNKMEKLESEFWNHTMVGANHAGYTDRFHELAKLVPHLMISESKRIGRYINRLAPQIRGMLRATQPTMIQSAILTVGIFTDVAVSCGTLTRSSEKIKEV